MEHRLEEDWHVERERKTELETERKEASEERKSKTKKFSSIGKWS